MDIGVFYVVLRDIYDDFDKKRQSVITDVDLSPDGKAKRLAKIDENRQKAVTQLQESFETAYNKELASLDKKLNVSKESPVSKAREHLQGELVKSVNLGELDKKYITLDDNSRTQLILSAIESTHKAQMDRWQHLALSQGNENWYRTQLQTAMADKNIERLELLSKSLDLKPDDIADKLKTEYESVIQQLKLDALSPEQRQAMSERETLQREKQLLDYSFENASQRNEYRDARNVNKETPVNEIKLVGSPSGRVQPNQSYQRYKG